jgi:hypothetical protein
VAGPPGARMCPMALGTFSLLSVTILLLCVPPSYQSTGLHSNRQPWPPFPLPRQRGGKVQRRQTGSAYPPFLAVLCLSLRGGSRLQLGNPGPVHRRKGNLVDPQKGRAPRISQGDEINTGGLGSLSFGNVQIDGKPVGMIYENFGGGDDVSVPPCTIWCPKFSLLQMNPLCHLAPGTASAWPRGFFGRRVCTAVKDCK